MNLLKILLLTLSLAFVSCAKKSASNSEEDLSETVVLTDEVDDELDELEGVEVVEDVNTQDVLEQVEDIALTETPQGVANDEVIIEDTMQPTTMASAMSGTMSTYTVEKNDTLMWIAFKVYGDYTMWKKLVNANPGLSARSLKAGMTINYEAPVQEFNWQPNGNPYLILRGDTLGLISNKVYGTKSKWRSIWDNNRVMIKNPNLIFAGFTLYYVPEKVALNQ